MMVCTTHSILFWQNMIDSLALPYNAMCFLSLCLLVHHPVNIVILAKNHWFSGLTMQRGQLGCEWVWPSGQLDPLLHTTPPYCTLYCVREYICAELYFVRDYILWGITFCAGIYFVQHYFMCGIIFCVELYFCRIIFCTGIYFMQHYFLYRIILYVELYFAL